MRKAILEKFILVLLAALCINSVIFYIASGTMILSTSRRDMTYTIKALDSVLEYDRDILGQMGRLEAFTDQDSSRVTLIRTDGTVIADSDAPVEELDNHLDREEMKAAVETGEGYARRYSQTLHKTMIYVACRSDKADMVLRLAVPYSGISEYLPMLLPAALVSFLVAMACSVVASQRFVSSVTRPLRHISRQMLAAKGDYTQLQFERYQYPEINVIAETIMNMSRDVKEYLGQIEKEKHIRQEFFSNASHELKTPITSIQGYAELLESDMIQDENMKRDFARRIKKAAAGMTGLINDILMISKLEAKDAEVVMSDVRISVLLEEITDRLKPQAASAQVFLHIDCQPLCIKANVQQMEELLTNLLSNAVKYNRPGGQVWVNIRQQNDALVIRVKDNGMGIPADSLDRIFERFYRVDKGRSRKQGGTGLGLSIVKHIVNFYHGTISVTSELEVGTEFVVSIPVENV
ncbi:MAG: GHKL domain-containing protein [Clostridium sp.]|nr:GHKL domain-containing protein [Clostridium sp.]